MSIILAPITGGVRCSYSGTGLTLKRAEVGEGGSGGEVFLCKCVCVCVLCLCVCVCFCLLLLFLGGGRI